MASHARPGRPWSDALGLELLSALSDEELARQWGPPAAGPAGGPPAQLQDELLRWARQDDEVRRWIIQAWRQACPDLVAAVDHALTAGLSSDSVRALEVFPVEDVLLALVTDEFDDGPARARAFLDTAVADSQRRPLLAALQRLLGTADAAPRRRLRVVILGGHPRDQSRRDGRLFEQGPVEVRWKIFERKQGPLAILKAVAAALRAADAALIVVGMASHALMHVARDQAQRRGIPWKCIARATDKQLTDALYELFPELAPDGK
jgi:hypothetical protein